MKFLIRRLLVFCTALAILGSCIYGTVIGPDNLSQYTFKEGIRTLDGVPIERFSEVIKDETIFIFITAWQIGCEACEKQMELLKEVAEIPAVEVVAVNIKGSENAVRKYAEQYPFIFLVGASQPPKGAGVPQTVVYGFNLDSGQWEVLHEWIGYQSEPIETFLTAMKDIGWDTNE